MTGTESIESLLKDSGTPDELRDRLRGVQQLREFAYRQLHLPTDNQYTTYIDLHRPYVTWSVSATRELSLEEKQWCYPWLGCLTYRGYFSETMARDYAEDLRTQGWEVYVGGVRAYSTLGWFRDPVCNTFFAEDPLELPGLLFHELAHHVVFLHGDTDFNEAFATTVEQEGVRRWLTRQGDHESLERYLRERAYEREFTQMIRNTRRDLQILFTSPTPEYPKSHPSRQVWLRREKERRYAALRRDFLAARVRWHGFSGFDGWFEGPFTNARLNAIDTYFHLVPGFEAILASTNGNLKQFFQEVADLGRLSQENRHRYLTRAAQISRGVTMIPP